jgi:murein DD-endopeptidase MepM/ murein hydrolase activator NlpD
VINPLSAFSGLVESSAPRRPSDPKRTAIEFEVLLLKQMLDQLPMPGLEGTEAGTFLSLVHESLARQIVEQGGGLGVVDQLGGEPGQAPAPRHARVSSGFGWRSDPIDGVLRQHRGLDLPAAQGTPIAAALGGVVSFAGESSGYGNLIVVDHPDGLQTAYAHCDTVDVQVGDPVDVGAKLGTVGSTGRSTGPHLHFEVRRDGQAIDPHSAGLDPWGSLTSSQDPTVPAEGPSPLEVAERFTANR